MTDREQAEGYRKALEQIREMHYYDSSATEMRQIAREALSDAATENPNAGHGWITGTADIDAIEGHAMREPVPEAGEAPRWRVGGKIPLNVYENDRPMFQCHTPEDARRIVAALNDWENADWTLSADINIQETIRQRDEQVKELREALKPFLDWWPKPANGNDYELAKVAYESTAPPAPCPTCKGKKFIKKSKQHPHGLERYPVPCPTCTEAKA